MIEGSPKERVVRDYRLYLLYVKEFGLTFLPRKLSEQHWEVATELMLRATHHEGSAVTHELIETHLNDQQMTCHDRWRKAVA